MTTGRERSPQPVQEHVGEEERGEVIDCERRLEAVHGQVPLAEDHARVVHEHVEPRIRGQELGGEAADVLLGREIAEHQIDRVVARVALDLEDGRLPAGSVARYSTMCAPIFARPTAVYLPIPELAPAIRMLFFVVDVAAMAAAPAAGVKLVPSVSPRGAACSAPRAAREP